MTVSYNKSRGRWTYDFICAGKRYQGYCVTSDGALAKNKTEARAVEESIKVKARSGKMISAPPPVAGFTLAEPMAFYLKKMAGKPDLKNVQAYVREALTFFGPATDMADIDEPTIEDYKIWLMQQRKKIYVGIQNGQKIFKDSETLRGHRTVNAYLQTVERAFTAFRTAPQNKHLRHIIPPALEIEYLPLPKRTPTPIPHNVSLGLLDKFDSRTHDHLRMAYILCIQTGLREKECAKIRTRQYLEKERVILLETQQTKSRTARFVPVNPIVHDVLMACQKTGDVLWEALKGDPDLACLYQTKFGIKTREDIPFILYRPNGSGVPRPVKHIASTAWKTLKKTACVPYRWHDTRAAFCTNALRGSDIETVRKLAGHRSIATTERYLEAADPQKIEAVNKLADNYPLPIRQSPESLTKVPDAGKTTLKKKRKSVENLGAGDGHRTRDPQLGKLMLYH